MTSTPMDIDTPDGGSPANGAAPSLNISRTLGNLPSTSAITDVIANFRPTKVANRPGDGRGAEGFSRLWPRRSKSSPTKSYITAASLANDSSALLAGSPLKKCSVPDEPDEPGEQNDQAEGDDKKVGLSSPPASAAAEPDVDATEKPDKPCDATSDSEQQFKRDDGKDGRGQAHILSLDYDDPGELLMTSESDETIHIYKVREGRHDKQLLSQKYGVKLAKFTHASSSIVYASTKVNDAIRYLTTHDNTFVRYFEGHEAAVTCLAMHPGNDDFISCSKDNTVRLWNAGTKNATGTLYLNTPYLSAFDPSGQVFAVGSPGSGQVLIYDHRNFDKAPCSTFDIIESCTFLDPKTLLEGWTKLEFSNDGRNILLGTKGGGHFLLDSFNGSMRAYLRKAGGNTRGSARLAPGEDGSGIESSGDCCFTSDGRYVLGAVGNKVLVWDTLGQVETETKTLDPLHVLDNDTRRTGVLAFNPRFNFFATAEQDLVFWIPMEE